MLRGAFSLLLLIAAMLMAVPAVQAGACPDMKTLSLSAFMGGEVPADIPLQVSVPADYGRTDLSGIHPARSTWLTLERAAVARRGGGLDDFMYGTPAVGVVFDTDTLAFIDADGRHLRDMMESLPEAKVSLAKVRGGMVLVGESKNQAGDRMSYVAYVAFDDQPEVLRLGYRPRADDPASGECIWQAFRTALVGDGLGVTVYSPTAQGAGQAVMAHADWIADTRRCPVDLMGKRQPVDVGEDDCAWTDGRACLARCESGDAGACFWLGRDLLVRDQPQPAEVLMSRACRLGVAEACTHRAAGQLRRDRQAVEVQACAHASFENACRIGDAWACTMLGGLLFRGEGAARDLDKARTALERACDLDPDTEACDSAKKTLARLDAENQ